MRPESAQAAPTAPPVLSQRLEPSRPPAPSARGPPPPPRGHQLPLVRQMRQVSGPPALQPSPGNLPRRPTLGHGHAPSGAPCAKSRPRLAARLDPFPLTLRPIPHTTCIGYEFWCGGGNVAGTLATSTSTWPPPASTPGAGQKAQLSRRGPGADGGADTGNRYQPMQPPLLAPSPMLPLKAVGAGRPSHLHPRPPPLLVPGTSEHHRGSWRLCEQRARLS